MWNKVMWLFVWVTLAFWVGCAGDNQNHRGHENEKPLFMESTPDEVYKGAEQATAPSVLGVTRENWGGTEVAPALGAVPHEPVYFDERGAINNFHWHVAPARPSVLTRQGVDLGYEAGAATHGDRMEFTKADMGDAALAPFKFLYDLGSMPFDMLKEKPTATVWTPALAVEAAQDAPEVTDQTVPMVKLTPAKKITPVQVDATKPQVLPGFEGGVSSEAKPATETTSPESTAPEAAKPAPTPEPKRVWESQPRNELAPWHQPDNVEVAPKAKPTPKKKATPELKATPPIKAGPAYRPK